MHLLNGRYLFGRIVRANDPRLMAETVILAYIYAVQQDQMLPPPTLSKSDLLLPPVLTNRLGWTKGYFATIGHEPLEHADVYSHHCFETGIKGRIRYYDDRGQEVQQRFEPCGIWGVESYRMLDDRVSDALGIPRSPNE